MPRLDKVNGQWVNLDKPGGQVFFVGGGNVAYQGKGASDINSGLTPEEPLSTISAALSKCLAGRGDTVVLLPGSITVTAAIEISKDDVTLAGAVPVGPKQRSSSVIVNATDVNTVEVNANDVTIEGITFDDNVATATADTAVIAVNTSNTGEDFTGFKCINCYLDMEGADADRDGIALGLAGDATDGAIAALVEGCVIWDCNQDAIAIAAGSDRSVVRNCHIADDGTILTRYGVDVAAISCVVEDCHIQVSDTATPGACVHNALAASRMQVVNCNLEAMGADTFCIQAIATATQRTSGNFLTATAAGNLVDYTTDNTSPSADANISAVFAATPGAAAFDDVTVGGS